MDNWIESGPHLMIMPRDPEFWSKQNTDFNNGAPFTMFAGSPYAHVMIPVEDYYHYQAQQEETKLYDATEPKMIKPVPAAMSSLPLLSMALVAVGAGAVILRVVRSRATSSSSDEGSN